jgi:hypothetical protein
MFGKTIAFQKRYIDIWKQSKATKYQPRVIWCLGNHEEWLYKYVSQNPELEGHMDVIADLGLASRVPDCKLEIIPYKNYIDIDGVMFTHAPIAGNGQAVSGKYALSRAAELTSMSMVFGHLHRFETLNIHRHGSGKLIQLLSAGAYFDAPDEYAEGCTQNYWKGITLLRTYEEGRFDIEQISLERIYKEYIW